MKKYFVFVSCLLLGSIAVAQLTSIPQPLPPQDFFSEVLAFIKSFGGLTTMMKISGIILIIIASMKVSIIAPIYEKLGEAQVFLAPLLGLVAGLLGLFNGASPVTLATVTAYVVAGGGAVFLHEILDSVKVIPGVGPAYLGLIDMAESILSKPTPPTP